MGFNRKKTIVWAVGPNIAASGKRGCTLYDCDGRRPEASLLCGDGRRPAYSVLPKSWRMTRWKMIPFIVTNVIYYVILANTIPFTVKNSIQFVSLANTIALM